ncbi:MAG: hypothetical protein ACYTBS_04300 [Planctomycetota bacterium]
MRRRRLYRSSMIRPIEPRRVQGAPEPAPHQADFERGIEYGMMISAMQQRQAVAAAQHHALALVSQTEARMARMRQEGFDQGYAAGMQARAPQPESPSSSKGTYTYADVEAARARGFEAGRRSTKSEAVPQESALRKKLIDEMLEQCRVISESNPNMAPGVNAVRHRIKKLG